jgi:uncharacterized membrane protein
MTGRIPVLVSVTAVLAVTALSLWAWIDVPGGTVPAGIGDDLQQVSKFRGLVVGPLLFTGLPVLAFWLIPLMEPRRANLLASRKAFTAVWIAVVALGVAVHAAFVSRATGSDLLDPDSLASFGIPILLVVTGNYLGKIRSNFLFGIRTPWTLSSDLSWNRTHRLAGRLTVLLGFVLLVVAFVRNDSWANFWAGLVGLAVVITVAVAYSFRVWKTERQVLRAGTTRRT